MPVRLDATSMRDGGLARGDIAGSGEGRRGAESFGKEVDGTRFGKYAARDWLFRFVSPILSLRHFCRTDGTEFLQGGTTCGTTRTTRSRESKIAGSSVDRSLLSSKESSALCLRLFLDACA